MSVNNYYSPPSSDLIEVGLDLSIAQSNNGNSSGENIDFFYDDGSDDD